MCLQLAEKVRSRHSERSPRSEGRFCIARLLCGESLRSWVSAQDGFLVSLGMTGLAPFSAACLSEQKAHHAQAAFEIAC
jgi:hypothetical protein